MSFWLGSHAFVFGTNEIIMTVLPVLIVVGIVGPRWLRELRKK